MMAPRDIAARFAAGVVARARWDTDTAERVFLDLCAVEVARPRALTELAVTLSLQGRGAEALRAIATAVELAPHDATIRQNALVLEKLREPEDAQRFVALHRQWGEDFAATGGSMHAWTRRDLDPERRLRLAYLGVDAHTALARFMPLLAAHHDAARFEVIFVHRSGDEAAVKAAMQAAPQVRHLHATDASARLLARTLAMLEIDIAIDIGGHGVGQVLAALAYRPAPLQLTWLDYVATTGVAAIDGRIADAITDPDTPNWSVVATERTLRLPFAQWCCTPFAYQAVPAPRSDGVVFGLINATNKISPALIVRAARLLQALPQSRLRVIGVSGLRARDALLAELSPALHARVDIIGRVDEAEFHRLLGTVDVALDPLVFSGATSTLDCLWAGVPVVTEPGVLPHTRSSASILETLGLKDWIAADGDAFVRIAIALAADAALRERLRVELPERLRASTLSRGDLFVPALESVLRQAWCAHACDPDVLLAASSDARERQQLLIARANTALGSGDLQQAIYALETLALAAPSPAVQRNLSRAWNNRGAARRRAGQAQEAADDFRTALEIWPENPEARANLGAA